MKIHKLIILYLVFLLLFSCSSSFLKKSISRDFLFVKGSNYYFNNKAKTIYPFYIATKLVTYNEYYSLMSFPKRFEKYSDSANCRGINFYQSVLYCNQKSKKFNLDTIYQYDKIVVKNRKIKLINLHINKKGYGFRLPYFDEMVYSNRGINSIVKNRKNIYYNKGKISKNGLFNANSNLMIWTSDSLNGNIHTLYGASYADKIFDTKYIRLIEDEKFEKYKKLIGIRVVLQDTSKFNYAPIIKLPKDTSVFIGKKIVIVPKFFDENIEKCKKYVSINNATKNFINDSLIVFAPNYSTILDVKFTIVDKDSLVSTKMVRVGVYNIPPAIQGENSKICSVNDSITINKYITDDKLIDSIYWKIGKSPFVIGDATLKFKAPSKPDTNLSIIAKVVDEDGEITFDTTKVIVLANAPLINLEIPKRSWINKNITINSSVFDNGVIIKRFLIINDDTIFTDKNSVDYKTPNYSTKLFVKLVAIDNDSMISSKLDTIFVLGPTGPKRMRYVPGSRFGKTYIRDFFIDSAEVTQKEFMRVMGFNPSINKGENLPVTNVSWIDAIMYCNRLSKEFGLDTVYYYKKRVRKLLNNRLVQIRDIKRLNRSGFSLPKLNQWQYLTENFTNNLKDETVYKIDNKIHMVASKSCNKIGVYDLYGNVSEWIEQKCIVGGNYLSNLEQIKKRVVVKLPYKAKLSTNGFRVVISKKGWIDGAKKR